MQKTNIGNTEIIFAINIGSADELLANLYSVFNYEFETFVDALKCVETIFKGELYKRGFFEFVETIQLYETHTENSTYNLLGFNAKDLNHRDERILLDVCFDLFHDLTHRTSDINIGIFEIEVERQILF